MGIASEKSGAFLFHNLIHKTMGAQDFIIRQTASSPEDAFRRAQERAISEYGHDAYNGTVSTCHAFSDFTKLFHQSGKEKMEFINDILHKASKRDCYIIEEQKPIKNNNKIRSYVEHKIIKGASKWELQYNVYTGWEDRQLKSFSTKTEAVKFAREHTEKTHDTTFVRMEKTLVNQDANVACIKYKHSQQEREGSYIIFGMAAC
jgi:hypothetical protein